MRMRDRGGKKELECSGVEIRNDQEAGLGDGEIVVAEADSALNLVDGDASAGLVGLEGGHHLVAGVLCVAGEKAAILGDLEVFIELALVKGDGRLHMSVSGVGVCLHRGAEFVLELADDMVAVLVLADGVGGVADGLAAGDEIESVGGRGS
jgi:hypothetical protein